VLAAKSSATPFFFFGAMMFLDVLLIATVYPDTTGVSLESLERKLGMAD
jgi:SP family arabinose:H+ symporter-like MFS transporter